MKKTDRDNLYLNKFQLSNRYSYILGHSFLFGTDRKETYSAEGNSAYFAYIKTIQNSLVFNHFSCHKLDAVYTIKMGEGLTVLEPISFALTQKQKDIYCDFQLNSGNVIVALLFELAHALVDGLSGQKKQTFGVDCTNRECSLFVTVSHRQLETTFLRHCCHFKLL